MAKTNIFAINQNNREMFESFNHKLTFSFKAIIFSPLVWFVETYLWTDWNLLVSMSLLLLLDGLVLSIRTMLDKNYHMGYAMRNFGMKTMGTALVLLAVGIFDNAMIQNSPIESMALINYAFYTMILAFLFISVLTNIYKIYPVEFLKKMIDKLNKKFEI